MDSHGTNQQRTVSVNEAKDILDRCIVFIGNCDNKSSIVLSLVGIIVAIVFSDDRVAKYIAVSKTVFQFRHWFDCLFFIGGVAALLSLFAGIFHLIWSLKAKVQTIPAQADSVLYFGAIAKNSTFDAYKKKVIAIDNEDLVNDYIKQIYINSRICSNKYQNYNRGLILSVIGVFLIILLTVAGMYAY